MKPSCALADMLCIELSDTLNGRRQPESVAKVGRSSTGVHGISVGQGSYGIS